jgi:hypothetical protein
MILADTSVLIDYLKGIQTEAAEKLQLVLDRGIPYGICPFVYQEVLQGARNEREFGFLKRYLASQKFYYPRDRRRSYEDAARIYFKCRKKGFQIGSTVDCLIAQTAIDNGLLLLHNDNDYNRIAKVSGLKFF